MPGLVPTQQSAEVQAYLATLLPDATKPGINSTGGQVSARADTPAGHFPEQNAAATHGAASGRGEGLPQDLAAPHQFPPCGDPRNHADEIENARWAARIESKET